MLYIRKLEISDENEETIYKVKNIKADIGLKEALAIVNEKQGRKETRGIFRKFLADLDEEFKNYFYMGPLK